MRKKSTASPQPELRRQAETQLRKSQKSQALAHRTEADTLRLVHELEVHQIELEMQNEELAQSRAQVETLLKQYSDLYDFAPVGYFTLARDGVIQQVNLTGSSLLGLERGRLIKQRLGHFVSAQSYPVFCAFLEEVFSAGSAKRTCEVEVLKDLADAFWVHIEAVGDEARATSRAVMSDITDRKRAEFQREAALTALRDSHNQLEQRVAERTRELVEANLHLAELSRLKDEFIARISHELRNPLTNVSLYLKLLEQGQPEKRAAYFQTMHQQLDRLQHLIEDLLDVSHLTLDTIEVQTAPLDVMDLLHSLVTDQAARALERGLTLAALPTPDRLTLTTDRTLLRQALSNVLTNALSYTPRGGTIALYADRATTPEGEWVRIEVRDTGPGIAAQDLPRLFEPFYRGAAAANYKIPGTGVGLAIAQRLIERLGGRITVGAHQGQGAAFTIWLNNRP